MRFEGGRRPSGADGFGPPPPPKFSSDVPAGSRMEGELRDPSRALALLGELGLKVTEESLVYMPILLSLLKHEAAFVIRQSIVSGTRFFCTVLEEIALQLQQFGKVERWLEEIWMWMVKFKDAICGIVLEPGSVGTRASAVKFLEVYILLFTSEGNDNEVPFTEGKSWSFNISRVGGGHTIFGPDLHSFEMNKCLALLLDLLQSASSIPGSLTIVIINCLAAIARKRPIHYSCILSALLDFSPDFDTIKGGHVTSIRYSLRTAFLGFLKCSHHPSIIESRDKLLRALRSLNPGEATEQIIRQVDKMSKNTDRISRDVRFSKLDDTTANHIPVPGDITLKKSSVQTNDGPTINDDMPAKRARFHVAAGLDNPFPLAGDFAQDDEDDDDGVNGFSSEVSLLDSDLTPPEKMIAMIGALLAEGERGAESLELLISQMQADLLADIVIANMKHLPKSPLPLFSRLGNLPATSFTSSSSASFQVVSSASAATTFQSSELSSQHVSISSSATGVNASSDVSPSPNVLSDSKRDPRRDPRRLDPRRAAAPAGMQSMSFNLENSSDMHLGPDDSLSRPMSVSVTMKVENTFGSLMPKGETGPLESSIAPSADITTFQSSSIALDEDTETGPSSDAHAPSDLPLSPIHVVDKDLEPSTPSEVTASNSADTLMLESDQCSSAVSSASISEETHHDLPLLPLYIDFIDDQKRLLSKSAVARISEAYKQIRATGCTNARLALLARLVAQANTDDDTAVMLRKHMILDYHHQKGHELAMHVLYHLHSIMISEENEQCSSFASVMYEEFLIALAKTLCDSLPASDKSFSRLFNEVPHLPESALNLLEDLCHSPGYDQHGKDVVNSDRVTQGLGAVWSLILVRPLTRQACLNIALKCAVHSQDEVRTKAIRLVANKLFPLSYVSENIEQFAKAMLLSVTDQRDLDTELMPVLSGEQRTVESQETSISGSQNSELGASESDSMKGLQPTLQSIASVSVSQANRYTSLFFCLCNKKPSLLRHVFDIYGRAPKGVKQSIHWHVPNLVRTLGSSYSELLHIISNPPEGSENLLVLVLQILTEEMVPSANLIATVKHLYETKLKDATILIPMLSSLSKEEVLPIFPRLVDLPMEKFQMALARILQGSAQTGPALTPSEVLVAIHDINPEKDGVALKKIMDACATCFEQRTVFTQHVLAKSLNHMVERTPLPLLFMRTVIQAVDAFPTLVDFVMEILSKLVNKQIWKIPKLWVGFLKCASQTQPHSFDVLLQLPPPQLESALNKYSNLRVPLAAYSSQPNIRSSLPRSTLVVLGVTNEQQLPSRTSLPTTMHTLDTSSSVHGAALT